MNDLVGLKHHPSDRNIEEIVFESIEVPYIDDGALLTIWYIPGDDTAVVIGSLPAMQQTNMDDRLPLDRRRSTDRIL